MNFDTKWALEGGIVDVRIDGINTKDAPDFVDAFIADAYWAKSGIALTDEELSEIPSDVVYEYVQQYLY